MWLEIYSNTVCMGEREVNEESKAIIIRDLSKKIVFSKTICKLNDAN